MLAPVGEATLGRGGAARPRPARRSRCGTPSPPSSRPTPARAPGYRRCGALHVALDRDEAAELRRRLELHERLGLGSEWLLPGRLPASSSPRCRRRSRAACTLPTRPRPTRSRWRRRSSPRSAQLGGEVELGAEIVAADLSGDGVELTLADGRTLRARAPRRRDRRLERLGRVAARGDAAPRCGRSRARSSPCAATPATRSASGIVAGERVYLVPRDDGRLLVGATVEERGFDRTLTAGGVHELLREAYRVDPRGRRARVRRAPRRACGPGARTTRRSSAPRRATPPSCSRPATYRNGILLAPVTGEAVAAMLAGEAAAGGVRALRPGSLRRSRARRRGDQVRIDLNGDAAILPDGATVAAAVEAAGAPARPARPRGRGRRRGRPAAPNGTTPCSPRARASRCVAAIQGGAGPERASSSAAAPGARG